MLVAAAWQEAAAELRRDSGLPEGSPSASSSNSCPPGPRGSGCDQDDELRALRASVVPVRTCGGQSSGGSGDYADDPCSLEGGGLATRHRGAAAATRAAQQIVALAVSEAILTAHLHECATSATAAVAMAPLAASLAQSAAANDFWSDGDDDDTDVSAAECSARTWGCVHAGEGGLATPAAATLAAQLAGGTAVNNEPGECSVSISTAVGNLLLLRLCTPECLIAAVALLRRTCAAATADDDDDARHSTASRPRPQPGSTAPFDAESAQPHHPGLLHFSRKAPMANVPSAGRAETIVVGTAAAPPLTAGVADGGSEQAPHGSKKGRSLSGSSAQSGLSSNGLSEGAGAPATSVAPQEQRGVGACSCMCTPSRAARESPSLSTATAAGGALERGVQQACDGRRACRLVLCPENAATVLVAAVMLSAKLLDDTMCHPRYFAMVLRHKSVSQLALAERALLHCCTFPAAPGSSSSSSDDDHDVEGALAGQQQQQEEEEEDNERQRAPLPRLLPTRAEFQAALQQLTAALVRPEGLRHLVFDWACEEHSCLAPDCEVILPVLLRVFGDLGLEELGAAAMTVIAAASEISGSLR